VTEKQLAEIDAAARVAAIGSARDQGLPDRITDPRVIAQVAALMRTQQPDEQRRAA
jgi:hypothetical protein